MKRIRESNFLSILLLFAILLTSCGGADAESDAIATAVAQTVSAQGTEEAQATATPKPTEADLTSTPAATTTTQTAATFSPPTAPGPIGTGSGNQCQALASLVSETIPDGTIMQPGETFLKTWRLKNTGTCTWNSAYKIVYWSGDLMGGALEYPLPAVVPPGNDVDISLSLVAPTSNGNVSGYWKLQSEWGTPFGVGQYDQPFYVQINVNDSTKPDFVVTNVTYNVIRDPAVGCATNVWYTVQATISTNGPAEVWYRWLQSDGNDSGEKRLVFKQATSITVQREWSMHLGVNTGTKWMQIVITAPGYTEYPQATFLYDCQ